jgi:hypothetical protein
LASQGFSGIVGPSGGCLPAERSQVVVSGESGTPTSGLLYVEGTITASSFPPSLELLFPGAPAQMFGIVGNGSFLVEAPLSTIPSSVNGTWTLCDYVNPGSPYTVTKWGLYFQ